MDILEFQKKYCNLNQFAGCSQLTWDTISNLEDDLDDCIDDPKRLECVIGATQYRISTIIEIMKEELPDVEYLKTVSNALNELKK